MNEFWKSTSDSRQFYQQINQDAQQHDRTDRSQIQNKWNFYFDVPFDPSYLQAVCRLFRRLVESTFNQSAFRTYSQSFRDEIPAVLTLPVLLHFNNRILAGQLLSCIFTKRKCGADFVYRMEGCGEPESDKRYNTPHLIDMGYRRTKIRLAIY